MQQPNISSPERNHAKKGSSNGRIKISDSALQRARGRVGLGGRE